MNSKILLCLALVLTGGRFDCAKAQAQDFTYTANNGVINITKYIGSGGAVTIPDKINGLPVTIYPRIIISTSKTRKCPANIGDLKLNMSSYLCADI